MRTDYMMPYGNAEMWHFFMHEEQGLCLRKKIDNRWKEHEILLDSAVFGFTLACDDSGGIHIACQDKEGGVLYLTFGQNVWHKYIILKSKSGQAYPKHFALVPQENELALCYSLRYNNYLMIAAQVIGRDAEPVVVDVVNDGERPFSCIKDGKNVRIIYTNVSGILGSKVYNIKSGTVGGHEPIMPAGGQAFAYGDSFGRIHIAALAAEGEGIAYCRRDLDGTFNGHQTVGAGTYKPQNPIIMAEDEKMWIMWEAGGNIFYALSVDDAHYFSEPVRFLFNGDSRQFHMVTPKEESVCLGYVTSGDEIHLFIQSGQNKIKGAQTGKINTQQQKAPARDHIPQYQPKQAAPKEMPESGSSEQTADIEAQKTQIMLTMLNTRVGGLKRQVAALTKRMSELEEIQANHLYAHEKSEKEKEVIQDEQPEIAANTQKIETIEEDRTDYTNSPANKPYQPEQDQENQKGGPVGTANEITGEDQLAEELTAESSESIQE